MKQYIKSYTIDSTFQVCDSITHRPRVDTDINWRKGIYQHFQFPVKKHGDFDTFILSAYFDDRFFGSHKPRYIRAPVTMLGPGPLDPIEEHRDTLEWAWAMNKLPYKAMLWYEGFQHPISTLCPQMGAAGLTRNVSGSYYYQQIMHCPLPEIDLLPTHISISYDACERPQTYLEIVYPRPERYPGARDIGVCTASLYGSLNSSYVPYFVNWMETLSMFGVIEVSLNNATLSFEDDVIAKAFDYYVKREKLIFTHYPVAHETWPRSRKYDDDASESVNKLTTGDCFYRNIKRYWYTLIIDMDELPVPTNHDTYADFLQDYLDKNPNLTDAHCLIIRTAFFNLDFPVGNDNHGKHLPLLRYTNRFRPEPIEDSHDGVGISKSFHNPRTCVASGHHLCRQGHEIKPAKPKRQAMPPEDILIHHYRAFCKYKNDCKVLSKQMIRDDILPMKYSDDITKRVERVLTQLDYPF